MSLPAFFRALWNLDPFPWQTMFAERVIEEGWPACLYIAVYAWPCSRALDAFFRTPDLVRRGSPHRGR